MKLDFKINKTYLKLTAFYVGIVMIISIGFSFALYNISSRELGRGLGRQERFFQELPQEQLPHMMRDFAQIRTEQLQESNRHLAFNLIYFNLLILILSSIASYFLAQKTIKPIEDAMEAQNRFTADASHELRTPLTAMKSEIEVGLRDKNFKLDDAKKLLGSNLEEIEKLEGLSGALLKLTRYQEDQKISLNKVLLEEVLVEAYEKVQSLAAKKSIEFENNLRDISIKSDKESLVELFVILVDNAIKYSPKRSKILIDLNKDGHYVVVKIKDQGIGIKASDLPHIFDRFYRADHSRSKEKVEGYGLGLSLAKQIVDLHHGEISVKSRPGKGSEFVVKLPIR